MKKTYFIILLYSSICIGQTSFQLSGSLAKIVEIDQAIELLNNALLQKK